MLSPRDKYLTLVPTKAAPSQPGRIRTGLPKRRPQRITLLMRPEHVAAAEIQPILVSLATADASLVVHAPTNLLVITERADNVRRLGRLLQQLDVPRGRAHLVFHSVLYADAADVATHVRTLFEDRVKRITVDERTNRLIVLAARDVQLEVVRLLTQLDLRRGNDGRVHTHPVAHVKAADIAGIVESLRQNGRASGGGKKSGASGKKSGGRAKPRTRTHPRAPASQPSR